MQVSNCNGVVTKQVYQTGDTYTYVTRKMPLDGYKSPEMSSQNSTSKYIFIAIYYLILQFEAHHILECFILFLSSMASLECISIKYVAKLLT